MTNKHTSADAQYEYRVWGKQRKARKILESIGTERTTETIEDCYFLGDDADWNAKVRNSTLKLKHLVSETRGFEQWTSEWHRDSQSTPAPFDQLFDDLHLDRLNRGKSFSISTAVKELDDDNDARPVFVIKTRIHYQVGNVSAETTEIFVKATGETLQTTAIVGDDLDKLVALRKQLGLKKDDNVAVHVAIDPERDN